jgi:hypothetical protein
MYGRKLLSVIGFTPNFSGKTTRKKTGPIIKHISTRSINGCVCKYFSRTDQYSFENILTSKVKPTAIGLLIIGYFRKRDVHSALISTISGVSFGFPFNPASAMVCALERTLPRITNIIENSANDRDRRERLLDEYAQISERAIAADTMAKMSTPADRLHTALFLISSADLSLFLI